MAFHLSPGPVPTKRYNGNLTAAQVEPTYILRSGRRLVQCCEHLHRHDFMRLLSAACIIL